MRSERLIALLVLIFLTSCVAENEVWVGDPPATESPPTQTVESPTVEATGTAESIISPTQQPQCSVSTSLPEGHLYSRDCPSMTCAVVTVLDEGQQVDLVQSGADWTRILVAGRESWSASKYLSCGGEQ